MSFQNTAPCFLTFCSSEQSLLLYKFKIFALNNSYYHYKSLPFEIFYNLNNFVKVTRLQKLPCSLTTSVLYILDCTYVVNQHNCYRYRPNWCDYSCWPQLLLNILNCTYMVNLHNCFWEQCIDLIDLIFDLSWENQFYLHIKFD